VQNPLEPPSLKDLAIESKGDDTYLYIGYDCHPFISSANLQFILADSRNSDADLRVQGQVAKYKLGVGFVHTSTTPGGSQISPLEPL
jgi:hypothetical protein